MMGRKLKKVEESSISQSESESKSESIKKFSGNDGGTNFEGLKFDIYDNDNSSILIKKIKPKEKSIILNNLQKNRFKDYDSEIEEIEKDEYLKKTVVSIKGEKFFKVNVIKTIVETRFVKFLVTRPLVKHLKNKSFKELISILPPNFNYNAIKRINNKRIQNIFTWFENNRFNNNNNLSSICKINASSNISYMFLTPSMKSLISISSYNNHFTAKLYYFYNSKLVHKAVKKFTDNFMAIEGYIKISNSKKYLAFIEAINEGDKKVKVLVLLKFSYFTNEAFKDDFTVTIMFKKIVNYEIEQSNVHNFYFSNDETCIFLKTSLFWNTIIIEKQS
jgi:hypothetical protein